MLNMGKQYSKNEEVIVAQVGANSASNSFVENHVKTYGSIIVIMLAIMIIFLTLYCIVRCRAGIKMWFRGELSRAQTSQNQKSITRDKDQIVYA